MLLRAIVMIETLSWSAHALFTEGSHILSGLSDVIGLEKSIGVSVQAMSEVGGSAVPGWAMAPSSSSSPLMNLAVKFIQLVGLWGVIKGAVNLVRYFSAEQHPKKPPNIGMPFAQIFIGLLCLVPTQVVAIAQDLAVRVGWA